VEKLPRVKDSTGVHGNWLFSIHSELAQRIPDIPAPHKYPTPDKQEYYESPPRKAFCFPFVSDVAFLLASDIPNRIERAKKRIAEALKLIGLEQMLLALDASEAGLSEPRTETDDNTVTAYLASIGMGYQIAIHFIREELLTPQLGRRTPQPGRSPLLVDGMDVMYPFNIEQVFDTMLEWQVASPRFARKSKVIENIKKLTGTAYMKFNTRYVRLCAALPSIERGIDDIYADIACKQRYALWPGITDIEWNENGLKRLSLCPRPDGCIHALISIEDKEGTLDYFISFSLAGTNPEYWKKCDDRAIHTVMEAIRMCVVPAEDKIRQNRVPCGYVKGPKNAPKGHISVAYIPRVHYVTRGDGGE